MSNEWRDLPTMEDVALAKAAGDEIQVFNYRKFPTNWTLWNGKSWVSGNKYRARSKPKVRKIKILGWINPDNGNTFTRREDFPIENIWGWIRYPKLDDEVEVPL